MVKRRRSPVLLICLGLTAYFGFHALQGKHGLEARSRLLHRSALLDKELRALEAVRAGLEREVALLAEHAPDHDFIEELARDLLGFARPRDVVVIIPAAPAKVADRKSDPALLPNRRPAL